MPVREAVQRGRVKDKTLSESDVVKRYVKAAEKGVLCSINPDAHDIDQLAFAAHGVRIARKGWLTPEQVLNTRSLPEVLSWLGR